MTTVTLQRRDRHETYLLEPEKVARIYGIIGETEPVGDDKRPTLDHLEKVVTDYFVFDTLRLKLRKRELVHARYVFYYLACWVYRYTLKGTMFSDIGHDHSDVIKGRDKIKLLTSGNYPDLLIINQLNEIKARINSYEQPKQLAEPV